MVEDILIQVIAGIILLLIGWFLKVPLRDRFTIKKNVKKIEDNKIEIQITVKNTGFLSANKNPVFILNINQYTIKDIEQINVIPISGSLSAITPKDPNTETYSFVSTGSMIPSISTSTDFPSGSISDIKN